MHSIILMEVEIHRISTFKIQILTLVKQRGTKLIGNYWKLPQIRRYPQEVDMRVTNNTLHFKVDCWINRFDDLVPSDYCLDFADSIN